MSDSNFKRFVNLVHEDDALTGVPFEIFRIEAKKHNDWPRVNWIWLGGTVKPNEDSSGPIEFNGCMVRCAFIDFVRASIETIGDDYDQAATLRDCVIAALYRLMGANFTPGNYTVWNEQLGTAEHTVSGIKIALEARFELLIGTEAKPITTIAGTSTTATFQDTPEGSSVEIEKVWTQP